MCLSIILFNIFGVCGASLIFGFQVFINLENVQPQFFQLLFSLYSPFPLGTSITHKLGHLKLSLFLYLCVILDNFCMSSSSLIFP